MLPIWRFNNNGLIIPAVRDLRGCENVYNPYFGCPEKNVYLVEENFPFFCFSEKIVSGTTKLDDCVIL